MLKIAIIGTGFGQYGLLPAFRSVKNCKVVAICGEKRPQLIEYCKRTGFKNIYSDWQQLFKKEKLDAVAIAVPPRIQYQIAKAAIKRGLHVFAEKPFAVNVVQARELFFLARQKKIVNGVDFIFPEIAEWGKLKELIDRNKFGKLKHISANWDFLSHDIKNKKATWKTSITHGGGALSYYFSHGLYYLEHFAGEIVNAKSLFTYSKESINGAEVGVDMLLKFGRGVTGYAHINCGSRGLASHELVFQCERGIIFLGNKGNSFVSNFTVKIQNLSGERQLRVKKDRGQANEDERVKVVKKLAGRFVNACIRRKAMSPSFKDGLRVQELIEKIRAQAIR